MLPTSRAHGYIDHACKEQRCCRRGNKRGESFGGLGLGLLPVYIISVVDIIKINDKLYQVRHDDDGRRCRYRLKEITVVRKGGGGAGGGEERRGR